MTRLQVIAVVAAILTVGRTGGLTIAVQLLACCCLALDLAPDRQDPR